MTAQQVTTRPVAGTTVPVVETTRAEPVHVRIRRGQAADHDAERPRAGPRARFRGRAPIAGRHPHSGDGSVARRLSWAEVAAVGPNVRSIRAGDRVLFNPEECFEVEVQGEDYLILRERDIPAVASERLEDGTGLYL